ncbi:helix-turn-helix transcriptional regulator [Paraburkholderia graminis]|uniref:helix-turn-helix transcriptional regulator n=1 Tax=Paraburkholderia graminis TaxID=60548 RepID=UPI0038BC3E6C
METPARISADAWTANAIAAIGTDSFGSHLERYLMGVCGIDFFACYRVRPDAVTPIASSDPKRFGSEARITLYTRHSLWAADPALSQATVQLRRSDFAYSRLKKTDLPQGQLRAEVYPQLVDRMLLCRHGSSGTYALSALRWSASHPFQQDQIENLLAASPIVFALIDRHYVTSSATLSPADCLASIDSIQQCLHECTAMPLREREVCARLLIGDTIADTALKLQIGTETARSYVKRAYQRLQITSQRELMVAYLRLWHDWTQEGRVSTER